MSGFDKILNFMKLNDDSDFEDDYEEEELVVKKPKVSKPVKSIDDMANTRPISNVKPEKEKQDKSSKPVKQTRPTLVPISTRTTSKGMEVCIVKPTDYDEVTEITDILLSGRVVVINLEGIDVDMAQRIVDFVSGSCYAMRGNFQKISNYIFIITPDSIDISGDFQEIIASGFDVPTINGDF